MGPYVLLLLIIIFITLVLCDPSLTSSMPQYPHLGRFLKVMSERLKGSSGEGCVC